MMTSGVYMLLAVVVGGLLFGAVSRWRGPRTAFLAICWLPLAGFAATYLARGRLGLGALAVLAAIFATSLCLSLVGLRLRTAARQGQTATGPLTWGTFVAALPLLILLAMWLYAG